MTNKAFSIWAIRYGLYHVGHMIWLIFCDWFQIIMIKVNMSRHQISFHDMLHMLYQYIQPHVYKIMYIAWAVLFKWFQIYHSIEYLASLSLRVPTFITLVINPTKQNSIFRNAFCVITKTIFITKYLPIQITLTQRQQLFGFDDVEFSEKLPSFLFCGRQEFVQPKKWIIKDSTYFWMFKKSYVISRKIHFRQKWLFTIVVFLKMTKWDFFWVLRICSLGSSRD